MDLPTSYWKGDYALGTMSPPKFEIFLTLPNLLRS